MREQNLNGTERTVQKRTPENVDLKNALISAIMELTNDERKELLAMWKGRNQC